MRRALETVDGRENRNAWVYVRECSVQVRAGRVSLKARAAKPPEERRAGHRESARLASVPARPRRKHHAPALYEQEYSGHWTLVLYRQLCILPYRYFK